MKNKTIVCGIIILAILLFSAYLYAMFLPGVWHGDAFLYKQSDGSFVGSDSYADYKMVIKPANYGSDIEFSVNEKINHYQIKYDDGDINRNVEISENGNVICKGKAMKFDDTYIVFDDETGTSDIISVRGGDEIPTEEELLPRTSDLYSWAVSDKTATRGNPYMLIFIFLFGVTLFIDIKYPDFFWILKYRWSVDGGEPSESYRMGQKIGYVLMPIGIVVCMVLTFTIH